MDSHLDLSMAALLVETPLSSIAASSPFQVNAATDRMYACENTPAEEQQLSKGSLHAGW
jgi:hypothetical protein